VGERRFVLIIYVAEEGMRLIGWIPIADQRMARKPEKTRRQSNKDQEVVKAINIIYN